MNSIGGIIDRSAHAFDAYPGEEKEQRRDADQWGKKQAQG